jgi:peptide-methionine (S)-S-oxide reductase
MVQVGFGGGCHWCTEAVFQALVGVQRVEQGWISSSPPNDSLSEAVRLSFDPELISLDRLIEAHLATHSSTSDHALRHRYRSAVYFTSHAQQVCVLAALAELAEAYTEPLVTRSLPLVGFTENEPRYQSYYLSDPDRPFNQRFIGPKLDKLQRVLPEHYRSPQSSGETP